MKLSKYCSVFIAVTLGLFAWTSRPYAHCEIPCGIYGDQMRIEMLKEHITTIEKSMAMIVQLSAESPVNYNQLVRWINNKDEHADQFQHIVSQYFMTQRIKPADPQDESAYKRSAAQLVCLHQMLVYAMKCKQSTDAGHIQTLRGLVDTFSGLYFTESDKEHLKGHH
ncbi:MAG: superoxide dismutase [Chitinivibrionia bacterium]|nr:superoxide dismutase [Chitinivibrionia bacterium]